MASVVASRETHATTVRLPRPAYDQAKHYVAYECTSSVKFGSLNDFFVTAIQAYLKLCKRRQIDAAFSGMAEDANYQKESRLLAEEFEASDWEALGLGEDHVRGDDSVIQEDDNLVGASSAR
ncbi:MAG TPA: hypothetical protein VIY53_16765 [Acidobacteriaceae bacterium]